MNPSASVGESSESMRKRKLESLDASSASVNYRLVDKNGHVIDGFGDSVSLKIPSNDKIDDFQRRLLEDPFSKDAVSQVPFAQIRIYQGESAFTNRVEGATFGQPGGPLARSSPIVVNGIQELGPDKDHPLWVVLPIFYKPPPRDIKLSELKLPLSVSVPAVEADAPPFTAPEGWLDENVDAILEKMNERDHHLHRVAPMALMRCSRGGKTRALLELGRELKAKLPDTAVIYISFNNETQLELEEQSNPIAALCRRIAFAASDGQLQFNDYRNHDFAKQNLRTWLGETPCILLIDELNLLQTTMDEKFAFFLKDNFLAPKNRYLVFSSHVVTAARSLSKFMNSYSSRPIIAPELPIVQSLEIAQRNFDYPNLSAREMLYYGCIPGLIIEARRGAPPSDKSDEAIDKCMSENLATDESVKSLLSTFISGSTLHVMAPLLMLMDSWCPSPNSLKVQWIPYHMMIVFESFSKDKTCSITSHMKLHLKKICVLFGQFMGAKEHSGDGWEALFVLTLFIRCLSEEFDCCFLPIQASNADVSLNSRFSLKNSDFINATKISPASKSGTKNHIAIYYPPHAQFEVYDVIVAHFDQHGNRELYGYQLKEGSAVAKSQPHREMTKSFVVRDNPPDEAKMNKKWHVASDAEIDKFFGHSGQQWTPKNWKKLRGD